ncbi:unnamed protein product [Boreogadus saida]
MATGPYRRPPDPVSFHPIRTRPRQLSSNQNQTQSAVIQSGPDPVSCHPLRTRPGQLSTTQNQTRSAVIQTEPDPVSCHPIRTRPGQLSSNQNQTQSTVLQSEPDPVNFHPIRTRPGQLSSHQNQTPSAVIHSEPDPVNCHPIRTRPSKLSSNQSRTRPNLGPGGCGVNAAVRRRASCVDANSSAQTGITTDWLGKGELPNRSASSLKERTHLHKTIPRVNFGDKDTRPPPYPTGSTQPGLGETRGCGPGSRGRVRPCPWAVVPGPWAGGPARDEEHMSPIVSHTPSPSCDQR